MNETKSKSQKIFKLDFSKKTEKAVFDYFESMNPVRGAQKIAFLEMCAFYGFYTGQLPVAKDNLYLKQAQLKIKPEFLDKVKTSNQIEGIFL
ncbi:hypothetical protein [Xanthovirga aplysinae]|uniref:hypothetical protein n=1 Tax=Xanthovirga aplysinae TaxID=2529853 RepID=UPI0012BB4947|nr:hypothetical protein [Xanthovirga aplysinae]MTI31423.1 hypothetical protein [Xanthovirga aplysinae]